MAAYFSEKTQSINADKMQGNSIECVINEDSARLGYKQAEANYLDSVNQDHHTDKVVASEVAISNFEQLNAAQVAAMDCLPHDKYQSYPSEDPPIYNVPFENKAPWINSEIQSRYWDKQSYDNEQCGDEDIWDAPDQHFGCDGIFSLGDIRSAEKEIQEKGLSLEAYVSKMAMNMEYTPETAYEADQASIYRTEQNLGPYGNAFDDENTVFEQTDDDESGCQGSRFESLFESQAMSNQKKRQQISQSVEHNEAASSTTAAPIQPVQSVMTASAKPFAPLNTRNDVSRFQEQQRLQHLLNIRKQQANLQYPQMKSNFVDGKGAYYEKPMYTQRPQTGMYIPRGDVGNGYRFGDINSRVRARSGAMTEDESNHAHNVQLLMNILGKLSEVSSNQNQQDSSSNQFVTGGSEAIARKKTYCNDGIKPGLIRRMSGSSVSSQHQQAPVYLPQGGHYSGHYGGTNVSTTLNNQAPNTALSQDLVSTLQKITANRSDRDATFKHLIASLCRGRQLSATSANKLIKNYPLYPTEDENSLYSHSPNLKQNAVTSVFKDIFQGSSQRNASRLDAGSAQSHPYSPVSPMAGRATSFKPALNSNFRDSFNNQIRSDTTQQQVPQAINEILSQFQQNHYAAQCGCGTGQTIRRSDTLTSHDRHNLIQMVRNNQGKMHASQPQTDAKQVASQRTHKIAPQQQQHMQQLKHLLKTQAVNQNRQFETINSNGESSCVSHDLTLRSTKNSRVNGNEEVYTFMTPSDIDMQNSASFKKEEK